MCNQVILIPSAKCSETAQVEPFLDTHLALLSLAVFIWIPAFMDTTVHLDVTPSKISQGPSPTANCTHLCYLLSLAIELTDPKEVSQSSEADLRHYTTVWPFVLNRTCILLHCQFLFPLRSFVSSQLIQKVNILSPYSSNRIVVQTLHFIVPALHMISTTHFLFYMKSGRIRRKEYREIAEKVSHQHVNSSLGILSILTHCR